MDFLRLVIVRSLLIAILLCGLVHSSRVIGHNLDLDINSSLLIERGLTYGKAAMLGGDDENYLNSGINITEIGSPIAVLTGSLGNLNRPTACKAGLAEVTFNNSGDLTAYGVEPLFDVEGVTIESIKLLSSDRTKTATVAFTQSNGTVRVTGLNSNFGIVSGLTDANADGKFNDLAAGMTFRLLVTYNVNSVGGINRTIGLTAKATCEGNVDPVILGSMLDERTGTATVSDPVTIASGATTEISLTVNAPVDIASSKVLPTDMSVSTSVTLKLPYGLTWSESNQGVCIYQPMVNGVAGSAITLPAIWNAESQFLTIEGGNINGGIYKVKIKHTGRTAGCETPVWMFRRNYRSLGCSYVLNELVEVCGEVIVGAIGGNSTGDGGIHVGYSVPTVPINYCDLNQSVGGLNWMNFSVDIDKMSRPIKSFVVSLADEDGELADIWTGVYPEDGFANTRGCSNKRVVGIKPLTSMFYPIFPKEVFLPSEKIGFVLKPDFILKKYVEGRKELNLRLNMVITYTTDDGVEHRFPSDPSKTFVIEPVKLVFADMRIDAADSFNKTVLVGSEVSNQVVVKNLGLGSMSGIGIAIGGLNHLTNHRLSGVGHTSTGEWLNLEEQEFYVQEDGSGIWQGYYDPTFSELGSFPANSTLNLTNKFLAQEIGKYTITYSLPYNYGCRYETPEEKLNRTFTINVVGAAPTLTGTLTHLTRPSCKSGVAEITVTNGSPQGGQAAIDVQPTLNVKGLTVESVKLLGTDPNQNAEVVFSQAGDLVTFTGLATNLAISSGLTDANADDKFNDLAAGSSFTLQVTYMIAPVSTLSAEVDASISLKGQVTFKSLTGEVQPSVALADMMDVEKSLSPATVVVPATITSDADAEVTFTTNVPVKPADWQLRDGAGCVVTNRAELTVPAGVVLASPNATFTPSGGGAVALQATQVGSLITIVGDNREGTYAVKLKLACSDAAISDNATLKWVLKRIYAFASQECAYTNTLASVQKSVFLNFNCQPGVAPVTDGNIEIRTVVPVDAINICGLPAQFKVHIKNVSTTGGLNYVKYYFGLPSGMVYVNNSVRATNSNNTPVQVSLSYDYGGGVTLYTGGGLAKNESFTLTFSASPTCALIPTTAQQGYGVQQFNSQQCTYNLANTSYTFKVNGNAVIKTDSYNLRYAYPIITVPTEEQTVNAYRYEVIDRKLKISNPVGAGSTSDLRLRIRYANNNAQLNAVGVDVAVVNVDGTIGKRISLPVTNPYGGDLVLKISSDVLVGIGLGDTFDAGESFVVYEQVKVMGVQNTVTTTYFVDLGCGTQQACVNPNNEAATKGREVYVVTRNVAPNLTAKLELLQDKRPSLCNGNGVARLTIKNNATDVAAAINQLSFQLYLGNVKINKISLILKNNTLVDVPYASGQSYITPLFTSDPDGDGGISCFDESPYSNTKHYDDLAPGADVSFLVDYEVDKCSSSGMYFYNSIRIDVAGTGSNGSRMTVNAGSFNDYWDTNFYNPSINLSKDMYCGDVKTFTFYPNIQKYANQILLPFEHSKEKVVVLLPQGLVPVNPLNAKVNVKVNGQTVAADYSVGENSISYEKREGRDKLDIDLLLDGSKTFSSGMKEVVASIITTDKHEACECTRIASQCKDLVYLHGCSEAPCISLEKGKQFTLERTTFGWPMSVVGVTSVEDLYKIPRLKREDVVGNLYSARAFDGIEAVFTGAVNTSICHPDQLSVYITFSPTGGFNPFEIEGGSVTVDGVNYNINAQEKPSLFSVTSSLDKANWRIEMKLNKADLPALFDLSTSSSFQAKLKFKAKEMRDMSSYCEARVLRGGLELLSSGNVVAEDSYNHQTYVFGYPYLNYLSISWLDSYRLRLDGNMNVGPFNKEFRPHEQLRNLEFTIPLTWEIDKIQYTSSSVPSLNRSVNYSVDNNGTLSLLDPLPLDNSRYSLDIYFKKDCSLGTFTTKDNKYSFANNIYAYADNIANMPISDFKRDLYFQVRKPTLQLYLEKEQHAYSRTITWPVRLKNEGNYPSPSTWISFEPAKSNIRTIKLLRVVDVNGTVIPSTTYGTNNENIIVNLGALNYNDVKELRLQAEYYCGSDDSNVSDIVNVMASWDPATGVTLAQPDTKCGTVTGQLTLVPHRANLAWEMDCVTSGFVNFKEPVNYNYTVTSNGEANMYDVNVDLELPQFLTLNSPANLIYGGKTIPLQSSIVTEGGKELHRFSLSHARVGADEPMAEGFGGGKQGVLNFSLTPECGFDAGNLFYARVNSKTNCNKEIASVEPLQKRLPIIGFEVLDSLSMNILPVTFTDFSSSVPLTFSIKNIGSAVANPGNLEVVLPANLQYIDTPGQPLGAPDVNRTNEDGTTTLQWSIPSIGVGVTDSYTIQVKEKEACLGVANPIKGSCYVGSQAGVVCPDTRASLCKAEVTPTATYDCNQTCVSAADGLVFDIHRTVFGWYRANTTDLMYQSSLTEEKRLKANDPRVKPHKASVMDVLEAVIPAKIFTYGCKPDAVVAYIKYPSVDNGLSPFIVKGATIDIDGVAVASDKYAVGIPKKIEGTTYYQVEIKMPVDKPIVGVMTTRVKLQIVDTHTWPAAYTAPFAISLADIEGGVRAEKLQTEVVRIFQKSSLEVEYLKYYPIASDPPLQNRMAIYASHVPGFYDKEFRPTTQYVGEIVFEIPEKRTVVGVNGLSGIKFVKGVTPINPVTSRPNAFFNEHNDRIIIDASTLPLYDNTGVIDCVFETDCNSPAVYDAPDNHFEYALYPYTFINSDYKYSIGDLNKNYLKLAFNGGVVVSSLKIDKEQRLIGKEVSWSDTLIINRYSPVKNYWMFFEPDQNLEIVKILDEKGVPYALDRIVRYGKGWMVKLGDFNTSVITTKVFKVVASVNTCSETDNSIINVKGGWSLYGYPQNREGLDNENTCIAVSGVMTAKKMVGRLDLSLSKSIQGDVTLGSIVPYTVNLTSNGGSNLYDLDATISVPEATNLVFPVASNFMVADMGVKDGMRSWQVSNLISDQQVGLALGKQVSFGFNMVVGCPQSIDDAIKVVATAKSSCGDVVLATRNELLDILGGEEYTGVSVTVDPVSFTSVLDKKVVTIRVKNNTGAPIASENLLVSLGSELAYVDGSAAGNGSFSSLNAGGATLEWRNVELAADAELVFSFTAKEVAPCSGVAGKVSAYWWRLHQIDGCAQPVRQRSRVSEVIVQRNYSCDGPCVTMDEQGAFTLERTTFGWKNPGNSLVAWTPAVLATVPRVTKSDNPILNLASAFDEVEAVVQADVVSSKCGANSYQVYLEYGYPSNIYLLVSPTKRAYGVSPASKFFSIKEVVFSLDGNDIYTLKNSDINPNRYITYGTDKTKWNATITLPEHISAGIVGRLKARVLLRVENFTDERGNYCYGFKLGDFVAGVKSSKLNSNLAVADVLSSAAQHSSCDTFTVQYARSSSYLSHNYTYQSVAVYPTHLKQYPNEFRPLSHIRKGIVTLPDNREISKVVFTLRNSNSKSLDITIPISNEVKVGSILKNGNQLIIDENSIPFLFDARSDMYVYYQPYCERSPTTTNCKLEYSAYDYILLSHEQTDVANYPFYEFRPYKKINNTLEYNDDLNLEIKDPDLTLTNDGDKELFGDEATWTVTVTNKDLSRTATYCWLYFQPNSGVNGSVDVLEVFDIDNKNVSMPLYKPVLSPALPKDGKFVYFTPVPVSVKDKPYSTRNFKVRAKVLGCDVENNISVKFGFAQTVLTAQNILPNCTSLTTTLVAKNAAPVINTEIVEAPAAPVKYCEPVHYKVKISAGNEAKLRDLTAKIILPEGGTLVSASYENVPLNITAAGWVLTSELVNTSNPVYIDFTINSQVGFDPGKPIIVSLSGLDKCNREIVKAVPVYIPIMGAEKFGDLQMSIPAVTFKKFGDVAAMAVNITNSTTNAIGMDAVDIVLPTGFSYVGMQTSNIPAPEVTERPENGTTLLRWSSGLAVAAKKRLSFVVVVADKSVYPLNSGTITGECYAVRTLQSSCDPAQPTINVKTTLAFCSSTVTACTAVPEVPTMIPPVEQTFCNGMSPSSFRTAGVLGASEYIWELTPADAGTFIYVDGGKMALVNWRSDFSGDASVRVKAKNVYGESAFCKPFNMKVSLRPANAGPITGLTTVCAGDEVTYTVAPIAGAEKYRWSIPSDPFSITTTVPSLTVKLYNSGDVWVDGVSGRCGSGQSSFIKVAVNPLPDASFTGLKDFYCFMSEEVVLLTPTVSGGNFKVNGNDINGNTFTPSSATRGNNLITYEVEVNGCKNKSSQQAEFYAHVGKLNSIPDNFCRNASPITLGGADGYSSFKYSIDQNTFEENQALVVDPTKFEVNRRYTVLQGIVEESNGCKGVNIGGFTVRQEPTVAVVPLVNLPICEGETVKLKADVVGNSPFTYFWEPGRAATSNIQFPAAYSADPASYKVTVKDTYGCQNSGILAVAVNPAPTITMINTPENPILPVSCPGISDGKFSFIANYISPVPLAYLVNPRNPEGQLSGSTQQGAIATVTGVSMGNQIVTVTAPNGCKDRDFALIENGGPVITICPEAMVCTFDKATTSPIFVNLVVNRKRAGESNTYTYFITGNGQEYTGVGTYGVSQRVEIPDVKVGDQFDVTVGDNESNHCAIIPAHFKVQSADLQLTINSNSGLYQLCHKDKGVDVTISASIGGACTTLDTDKLFFRLVPLSDNGFIPVDTYKWEKALPGNTLSYLNFLQPGTYRIEVRYRDQVSCANPVIFTVKPAPELVLDLKTYDVTCFGAEDGRASAFVTGNISPLVYSWSPLNGAVVGESISANASVETFKVGNYRLVVKQADGCGNIITQDFTINEPALLELKDPKVYWIDDEPCKPWVQIVGGTPPYTLTWRRRMEVPRFVRHWTSFLEEQQKECEEARLLNPENEPCNFLDKFYRDVITHTSEYSPDGKYYAPDGKIYPGEYKIDVVDAHGCTYEMEGSSLYEPTPPVRTYNIAFRWKSSAEMAGSIDDDVATKPFDELSSTQIKDDLKADVLACIQARMDEADESIEAMVEKAVVTDNLNFDYTIKQGYYTLYYYDRAGNLIRTVAPSGVDLLTGTLADMETKVPSHTFKTEYAYNNLGQLTYQKTPDAGESRFIYNAKGQLRFSQNAQQAADKMFSYTKYDALGRVLEVGECNMQLAGIGNLDELQAKADADMLGGNLISADDRFPKLSEEIYPALSQRTVTVYSTPDESVTYLGSPQRYLLNRVSYTYAVIAPAPSYGQQANEQRATTYYSYDPHGNVEWLVQEQPELGRNYIAYEYDLISNKVTKVSMNAGRSDAFYHRYAYDEDNRLQTVYTSPNGVIWDRDAAYYYYDHGPLKRLELGQDRIQGIDYTYTLQGWLKAINTPDLVGLNNEDKDKGFGRDQYGMVLGYHEGDFVRTSSTAFTAADPYKLAPATTTDGKVRNLYNGNISTWTNSYRQGGVASVTGEQYSYDMLNRITASKYNNLAAGTVTPTPKFATSYSYDLNGNIMQLNRSGNNASGTEPDMDKLAYSYMPGTNKLKAIKDVIDDDIYENVDVDNQVPDVEVNDPDKVKKETNYTYDDIGNLKEDKQAGVTIKWTVYGKVAEVVPMAGSGKPHVKYTYDAAGNRIAKQVNRAPQDNNPSAITTTYYLRDASGNTMAVYERNIAELGSPAGVSKPNGPQRVVANSHKAVYIQREVSLYGSDRLGIYKPDVNTPLAEVPFSNLWAANLPAVAPTTPAAELLATRTVGLKEYELKDHLGNVRAVVTDAKVGTAQTYCDAWINGSNTYHYYPFGMLMPGTGSASGETAYRYGYNGKEKDPSMMGNDATYDYGFRIYDARIAKFLSVDPLTKKYPELTPYQFASNRPIDGIDLDGLEWAGSGQSIPAGESDAFIKGLSNGHKKGAIVVVTTAAVVVASVYVAPYVIAGGSSGTLGTLFSSGAASYTTGVLTATTGLRLGAATSDVVGQFAGNYVETRSMSESASNINWTSPVFTAINPTNILTNSLISNTMPYTTKNGGVIETNPSKILTGVAADFVGGKSAEGLTTTFMNSAFHKAQKEVVKNYVEMGTDKATQAAIQTEKFLFGIKASISLNGDAASSALNNAASGSQDGTRR